MKADTKSDAFAIGALFLGVAISILLGSRVGSFVQPSPILLSPPEDLKYFTLGYNDTISDTLWIRVIQDLDICEQSGKSVLPVNSQYTKDDYTGASEARPVQKERIKCHRGWPFRMLRSITEISPDFRMPYTIGAIVLSVMGEDREGATELFERGLKKLPDDWGLAYKAAYHFLIEEQKPARAAELLVKAGELGAPRWVYALGARLMSENGQLELAESVLKQQIEAARTEEEAKMFESRLEAIRARIKKSGP